MSKPNRAIGFALLASALLNFLLLGFVAAQMTRPPAPPPDASRRQIPRRGGPLGAVFGTHREELMALRQQVNQSREDVRLALRQDPFDADKLQAAFATLRDSTNRAQQALHKRIVEKTPQLSLEQRQALSGSRRLFGPRSDHHRHNRRRAGPGGRRPHRGQHDNFGKSEKSPAN